MIELSVNALKDAFCFPPYPNGPVQSFIFVVFESFAFFGDDRTALPC
jgi:hypothetical protein